MVRPVAVPTSGTKVTESPDKAKGVGVVKAPMPGLVMKVDVKISDEVKNGQTVAIIEAMKMQNSIHASVAGIIKAVSVKEGESVNEGQEIVVIE